RSKRDWSSDVCSSDLGLDAGPGSGDAVDRLAQYHDGPVLLDLRLVRTALTDDLRGPVPELIGSPTAQVVQDELLRQGDRIGGGVVRDRVPAGPERPEEKRVGLTGVAHVEGERTQDGVAARIVPHPLQGPRQRLGLADPPGPQERVDPVDPQTVTDLGLRREGGRGEVGVAGGTPPTRLRM